MNILKILFNFLVNDFLGNPIMLIGFLVALGYILRKETKSKTITGTITAMVGLNLIMFGGSQMTKYFKPITDAVNKAYGIKGYLMDPYAMRAATQEGLGSKFGLIGYVFLVAFMVNVLIVYFGKYTKMHGIFLTGHTGFAHSQAVLWLVVYYFAFGSAATVLISGVLLGVYWAFSTNLAIKSSNKITNNAGFTIAHNQMVGMWFFSKIARFFGDPEEHDAEKMNLPGWLSIFNNNVVSVAIIMTVFIGCFMMTLGINGVQKLAGDTNWFIYILMSGINFSMYMVLILTGVRMFIGELSASFKGIQEKLIPNAVPGVDVAAILAYSPNAATLGFLFCTLGTIIGMGILMLFKVPYMVLTGFVPLFFDGGPIGVVANKYGGWRAVAISGVLLGLIHVFGTVWMIKISGLENSIGWAGMFDWSTVWPAITELMRMIAKIFSLGPFGG